MDERRSEEAGIRMVVGLGNPGRRYEGTRHNVGFMVVDRLVASRGALFASEARWEAAVARDSSSGLLFVKPLTFMNLSGQAVASLARFHRVEAAETLVVYDDVDLPLGTLRFRVRGSAGGHNGVRSLIASLKTEEFARLKLGIAGTEIPRDTRIDLADYVLQRFDPREEPALEKCLDRAVDAVEYALAHGLDAAMDRFNRRPEDSAR